MRHQALAIAGAIALAAAPLPAAAQPYHGSAPRAAVCQQQRQTATVAGGLIGALAGALLGSQIASDGARADGGLLGALAGAVAGGAIGRSAAPCAAGRADAQAPAPAQRDDDYGLDGGPNAPAAYRPGF